MEEPIRCELISWHEVDRLVGKLVAKVRQASFKPDIVIAIARGGYVPARLVCDHMNILNLTSIRIIHYQAGSEMMDKARLSMPLAIDVQGLNVLVVDDVSDTGDTLQLAIDHIEEFKPADIKLAVLHHKSISTMTPDIYGQMIVKWRWLIYPWAIYEDVGQFIATMEPRPSSVEDILVRLQHDHGIKVPERVVKTLLSISPV